MSLFAQLTVSALWAPLALAPPAAPFAHRLTALEAEPPEAIAPSPMAPSAVAPTVVVSPATTVVTEGSATTIVTPGPIESVSTTTTSSTTTTAVTTTVTTAPAPAPGPSMSPKAAVRTLLRYDPYLAPRYRSGRNMVIGGAVMLGVGTFTLLGTLSWASRSRLVIGEATSADERQRLVDERNRSIPLAQVVGGIAATVAVTGIVLLVTGAVRKRRAVEEARGRVFMQAAPGGLRVRF